MIPPLARTLLILSAGLGLAFVAIREPEPPESNLLWILRDPTGTRGCPGLERQLAAWQRELALSHWTIEIRCGPLVILDRDDLLGQAGRDREKRTASIWVREGLSLDVQQGVLVHELVHVAVAADRWWVPAGRDEEEFVYEFAMALFLRKRHSVERAMLEDYRQAARPRARAAAPAD